MGQKTLLPYGAVKILVGSEDGMILVRKTTFEVRYWSMPGGSIEINQETNLIETEREAAARELFEETGLAASPDEFELITRGSARDESEFRPALVMLIAPSERLYAYTPLSSENGVPLEVDFVPHATILDEDFPLNPKHASYIRLFAKRMVYGW